MKSNRYLKIGLASILLLSLLIFPTTAIAQSYLFSVDELTANVYINADGTVSLQYDFMFRNANGAHIIDFVDVGMPNNQFSMTGITAEVDGAPVSVSRSDYQGSGSGFAVVLGSRAIPAGQSGRVRVFVPRIDPWLRTDSRDPNYASINFSPVWFGREYVRDDTQMTVTFHLPPGVQPDEPRWHAAPSGFPPEPAAGIDADGRITYSWSNAGARAYEQYDFGASFPSTYVPAGTVVNPSISESLGIDSGTVGTCVCFSIIGAFIASIAFSLSRSASKRKLQYMPPKIAIEGMGIKRGLTAIEAAILMEQPLDKVLTMILFGLVKKNAATVTKQDPLTIDAITPPPTDLLDYERDFLAAFQIEPKKRREALQNTITDLVKSVSGKMKGFSRRETVAYYKGIMERAWKQVEDAQTPDVRMAEYDKYMEWTMLDRDYDDRTRRVFTGPVIMPTWYPRYDPSYRPAPTGGTVSTGPSGGGGQPGGGISLPSLPGSAFAASVVRGVQNFSSGVIGNVNDFTSTITNRTNPVPPPTTSTYKGSSRSGGGCACACACACAGCACACAGGGR